MTTAPGNLPSAISFFSIEVMRPSRSGDIPTCSGVAVARGWSSRAQTGSDTVVASTIAANAVVAANIFHLDMTFLPDRFFASSLDLATILSDIVTLDMESAIAQAAIRNGGRCPA